MSFEELRLAEPILRAVRAAGYDHPTPIQQSAIPHVLAGRDVLGCAQTGTGKTAAFALPVLQRLSDRSAGRNGARNGVRVLVLCPTRELAQQIHDSFRDYGRYVGSRQTVVFGGVGQGPQVRALRAGVDILVATPGRLLDLMNQRHVSLAGVEMLVLDEADRMLDMGFQPDLRRILAQLPAERQTLLFSATMPASIRTLAEDSLRDPVPVQVSRASSPTPTVAHWVYHVEKPAKSSLLTRLLAQTPHTRALIFIRTKHGADRLTRKLVQSGVRAASLHGDKSQSERTRALEEFRSARTPVLVATDIAARGLDVDDISHVINYDLTPDPETYVHRIGRTGRAGATGTAVSFCTPDQYEALRAIEQLIRAPLQLATAPTMPGDSMPPQRSHAVPRHRQQVQAKRPQPQPQRRSSTGPRREAAPFAAALASWS